MRESESNIICSPVCVGDFKLESATSFGREGIVDERCGVFDMSTVNECVRACAISLICSAGCATESPSP